MNDPQRRLAILLAALALAACRPAAARSSDALWKTGMFENNELLSLPEDFVVLEFEFAEGASQPRTEPKTPRRKESNYHDPTPENHVYLGVWHKPSLSEEQRISYDQRRAINLPPPGPRFYMRNLNKEEEAGTDKFKMDLHRPTDATDGEDTWTMVAAAASPGCRIRIVDAKDRDQKYKLQIAKEGGSGNLYEHIFRTEDGWSIFSTDAAPAAYRLTLRKTTEENQKIEVTVPLAVPGASQGPAGAGWLPFPIAHRPCEAPQWTAEGSAESVSPPVLHRFERRVCVRTAPDEILRRGEVYWLRLDGGRKLELTYSYEKGEGSLDVADLAPGWHLVSPEAYGLKAADLADPGNALNALIDTGCLWYFDAGSQRYRRHSPGDGEVPGCLFIRRR